MEFFGKTKVVKLRSHLDKYLVADDDQVKVRQSRNGTTRKARWLVEFVGGNSQVILLKSSHGKYLTASAEPFLLGLTGNKVLQTTPENANELRIQWQPVRDGFQVKLRSFCGTFLRGNGATMPWRNSVTHDSPHTGKTHNWILWGLEAVDVPEDDTLMEYLSMVSSFSSVADELSCLELGSPVSVQSVNSPRLVRKTTAMDMFLNAKAVRLRSHHDKYLTADEDEESITQSSKGSSKSARWTVETVSGADNIIRFKSCYGKYLTASNQPFLLGMTGRKVLQTLPSRLDSSLEWEPIREGNSVKLRTRYGQFLRANGSLPPWRNSVTHGIPHRNSTQDWILWHVDVLDIVVVQSPSAKPPTPLDSRSDSFTSDSSSQSIHSIKAPEFPRHESGASVVYSPSKGGHGRTICYYVVDEFGNVDESVEGLCIIFKGNDVEELANRLEEVTALEDIVVCSKSPLNGKLYPLRLQLPPNNVDMTVFVVPSSSKVARDLEEAGML